MNDDLISRAAAIDELMDWVEKEEKKSWSTFKGLFHWAGIKAMIECLPSAQPELIEKEAYIRGFEQGRTQGMIDTKAEEVAQSDLQPTCNQLATDAISRRAAIDLLRKRLIETANNNVGFKCDAGQVFEDASERIRYWIDELPSAQPERKKGEWIPEFDGKFTGGAYWFSCSKCKRIVPEVRNGGWNFCPQCGADMREGSNE